MERRCAFLLDMACLLQVSTLDVLTRASVVLEAPESPWKPAKRSQRLLAKIKKTKHDEAKRPMSVEVVSDPTHVRMSW